MDKAQSSLGTLLRLSMADWASLLLVLFVVLFPKGGVKVGEIPITWGYVLIAIFATIATPFAILDTRQLRFSPLTLFVLCCLFPFQCSLLLSMLHGVESIGAAFSTIISFFIFPVIFLLLWRPWYRERLQMRTLNAVRICIYLAALFGVAMFIMRLVAGKTLEIPLLTVNLADYGQIEDKDNLRYNLIMKLVSTYNNGNVYGAATLILLPMFDFLEPNRWRKVLVRLALLLTLSRTAWIGLIVERLLVIWPSLVAIALRLPVISVRRIRQFAIPAAAISVILLLVILLAVSMPGGFGMLTDTSLGGRVASLNAITAVSLFPSQSFSGFGEMVYPTALGQLGITGLIAILILFFCPLGLGFIDRTIHRSGLRQAAIRGLLLYAIIAWSDGAIEFIPVMCFYWFTMAIAIHGCEKFTALPVQQH